MKIFTASQIHELDKYTIEHEPITSLNLMERAAEELSRYICRLCMDSSNVVVFAGPGNNGGDALAVTRLLCDNGVEAVAYLFNVTGKLSDDCAANRDRLKEKYPEALREVVKEFEPPQLDKDTLVVDGLFGSGLSKPLNGGFAEVVRYINQSESKIVSIDLPSGLMTEDNTYNIRQNIIHADYTLTLGMKKLCMMLQDNQQYLGELRVLDIGLSKEFIEKENSQYVIVEDDEVASRLLSRENFAHKGTMGHALLVAGHSGMAGASILAAKACLRSGVGKITVHIPKCNSTVLPVTVPEAVLDIDRDEDEFTQAIDGNQFDAIGIGPGLGMSEATAVAMMTQIRSAKVPVVIDADALNLLALHRAWLQQLPEGMILTPHPKEMDRLCDTVPTDDYDRLVKACDLAQRLKAYIVLKGHYTALCKPNGNVVFNNTGNAGMATAGSGDVLTGIITALLARGYRTDDAAMVGVYLHGLAGDMACEELGMESLIASDIIRYLPKAFSYLQNKK